MIGFLIAAAISGSDKYFITVGNSGNSYGWSGAGTTFGSIDPDVGATGIEIANGNYINRIYTPTIGGSDLTIQSDNGGVLQSDFTTIYVQRSDGTFEKYDTATADNFNPNNPTGPASWVWGAGTADIFESTSSGEVRGVIIIV